MKRARRGFTLLEVMISLAILAVGLVAIGDLNAGAVQMHAYARKASEASLLLRGKMLDIEELLHKDGFSDYDDEKHGDFDDDHVADYTWSAEILKPDLKLDASQLLSMLGGSGAGGSGSSSSSSSSATIDGSGLGGLSGMLGALGGSSGLAGLLGGGGSSVSGAAGSGVTSGSPGGVSALASAGPFAGLIQGQITTFVETIKKSVREIRLTVTWKDGSVEQNLTASQIIVVLPESVGTAGQTQQLTPQQAAQQQQQNAANGAPANLGAVNISNGESQ